METWMSPRIEAGWIKRHKGSLTEEVSYEMRFLEESSLKDVMSLQETIAENLPDPELFRLHPVDYFSNIFKLDRAVIGVFTEDGLIAYSTIYIPDEEGENLGADINIPEEELKKVAHLQIVVVHPAYRGNMLQRRIVRYHMRVIQDMGYEHLCCTVSPKNPISLQNFFYNGFVIKGLKIKFGWMLRYIMYKNLLHLISFGPEEVIIQSSDIQGQIDLLNRGFLGYKMTKSADGFEISMARQKWIS